MMLKFTCTIRPHKAELLCERLLASFMVSELHAEEVLGRGRRAEHDKDNKGASLEYLPKVLVTAYIESANKDAVIDIVLTSCRSGHVGDGKIFFTHITSWM